MFSEDGDSKLGDFSKQETKVLKQDEISNVLVHDGNATRELINTPYQNTILCIENSVDVSLLENEQGRRKGQQHCAISSNINSFSLDEDELLPTSRSKIYGEKTIDFMEELRPETVFHCKVQDKEKLASEKILKDTRNTVGVKAWFGYTMEKVC